MLIRQSMDGLKVREMDYYAMRGTVEAIIMSLYTLLGQIGQKPDVQAMCKPLIKDLQTRYRGLTLSEVEYALNAGVRGDYGEYYGINVVTINKWLKMYCSSEARREANREKNLAGLPEYTGPTAEEKRKIIERSYEDALNDVRAGKYVKDLNNVIYDMLDRRGKINFTVKQKWAFMEQAKRELEAKAGEMKLERMFSGRLDSTTDKMISDMTKKDVVVMRAKRIALNVYLKKIVESES
jgi:ribosomal protein L15